MKQYEIDGILRQYVFYKRFIKINDVNDFVSEISKIDLVEKGGFI